MGFKNNFIQDNLDALEDNMFIVSSDLFKKLNDKTQVITNSNNVTIRKRLTHSLEVASIGKYIAEQINLENNMKIVNPSTVENVGMIHDIGHPPLGHIGAKCLSEVFSKYNIQFDDNANSLVIFERYYPNLSRLAILSTIKYPFLLNKHGQGLYDFQANYINELNEIIKKQTISGKPLNRTYESYIMELSDDISYLTGDLEDFIKHYEHHLDIELLNNIWNKLKLDKSFYFDLFSNLNKENIELNVWRLRKLLIRDISFNIEENKFFFKSKTSILIIKILREITMNLFVLKYSIRSDHDIAIMFRKYINLLISNINKPSFLKKELSFNKKIVKEIIETEDNNKKLLLLSFVIAEMTDKQLMKKLKKHFLNFF